MPPAPRTRLSKAARREQLLDTAAEMVLSRGFDALTMESIAQEAGASKTLGYAYFTNVDDLIGALYERELAALYARVELAVEGISGFDDRIAAAVHAYFDIVRERGRLLGLLQEGMGTRGGRRGRRQATNSFIGWLAGLVQEEFGVADRRARSFAAVLANVADTHARVWLGGRFDRAEIEAGCTRFMLAGLRAALETEPQPTRPF